jgi:hypothetical protein
MASALLGGGSWLESGGKSFGSAAKTRVGLGFRV